ncbi:DMT family transporter [Capnocytophaga cynodegmi]|uniref:DMT family transporter n=1 Tax=Capnocytophaga cynodegmi TaxID=28189 RepID=UPI00385915C6
MNTKLLFILAFMGGVCLAIQAAFNSQLTVLLKKPIFTTFVSAISSVVFSLLFVLLLFTKDLPNKESFREIPWYLWLAGGFFSIAGLMLYFITIPKIGITKVIVLGLCGQLVLSVIAGHFGWLNLPADPITLKKSIGVVVMIIGILLIYSK